MVCSLCTLASACWSAGLVEDDREGDRVLGVDGCKMYADCDIWWWWIWGGDGVGFGDDACLGPKLRIGEELLRVMAGKGSVEVTVSFDMV